VKEAPEASARVRMGQPSDNGRFGSFGGRFIPESLVPACQELEAAFVKAWSDEAFLRRYRDLLRDYAGPPVLR
jgi:tryptophan synthase beta chain